MVDWRRLVGWGLVGLAYGTVLAGFAFVAIGFGEGAYTLLGIVSAPLGFAAAVRADEAVLFSLVGCPFLWAGLIVLAVASDRGHKTTSVTRLLLWLHYLSAGTLISPLVETGFSDWAGLPRTPVESILGFAIYLAGQVFIWRRLRRRPEPALNPARAH